MKRKMLRLALCMLTCLLVACSNTDGNTNETTPAVTGGPVGSVVTETPVVNPNVTETPVISSTEVTQTVAPDMSVEDNQNVTQEQIYSDGGEDTEIITTTPEYTDKGEQDDNDNHGHDENIISPIIGMIKYYAGQPEKPISMETLKGVWRVKASSKKNLIDNYLDRIDTTSEYMDGIDIDTKELAKEIIRDYLDDTDNIYLVFEENNAMLVEYDEANTASYTGDDGVTGISFKEYDVDFALQYYEEYEMLVMYNREAELIVALDKYLDNTDELIFDQDGGIIYVPKGYSPLTSLDGLQGEWEVDADLMMEYLKEVYYTENKNDISEEEYWEEFEYYFGSVDEFRNEAAGLKFEIVEDGMIISEDDNTQKITVTREKYNDTITLADEDEDVVVMLLYNVNTDTILVLDEMGDEQIPIIRKK